MEIALSEKTKLIYEDVYQFRLKNDKWNIDNYLYTLNEQETNIDSTTFKKLVDKSLNFKAEKWKKGDLKNTFLIKKGEKVEIKKVLSELTLADRKEEKSIKKLIRKYNSNPNKWRGLPISVSNPIFSDNNEYCLIGYRFGNNGGYTELYKKNNSDWKLIGIFDRFAY
jgi:hypothetical protein